jgi:ectoine hydroxylase-related dioxygenase (phytanoyl-CoA dioxygenase family)
MSMRMILEDIRTTTTRTAYGVNFPMDFGFRKGSDKKLVTDFNGDVYGLIQDMVKELIPHSDESITVIRQAVYKKYGRELKKIISQYQDHIDSKLMINVDKFVSKVAAAVVFDDEEEYERVFLFDDEKSLW